MIRLRFRRRFLNVCLVAVACAACGGPPGSSPLPSQVANAGSEHAPLGNGYKVLYSFKGGHDGAQPSAGLLAVNGRFYGTTVRGGNESSFCGAPGCGTVFAVSLTGQEHVLHRFAGISKDGESPSSDLITYKGELYGTAVESVFAISAAGKEHTLYSFGAPPDGSGPNDLVELNGVLYGTTTYGGQSCGNSVPTCGTVFSVSLSGKEKILHYFFLTNPPKDGIWPYAGLTLRNGIFFGTTTYGGSNNGGTVFRISPTGNERIVYAFQGGHYGNYPASPLTYFNGEFYGTTQIGGAYGFGTVFAVTPSGKERLVYTFKGPPSDGNAPIGQLTVVKGYLYGATMLGGSHKCFSNGQTCGTIFKVSPSGGESILYEFNGRKDGATPRAGLTLLNSHLYGTTYSGGSGTCAPTSGNSGGCGTVFEISP